MAAGASLLHFHDLDHDVSNHLIPMMHAAWADVNDIRYLLWTRGNSGDNEYYQLVFGDLANLQASPLNPDQTTHVIYHGFNDEGLTGWIRNAKTELLKQCDCNVIVVDWKLLAVAPWYFTAVHNLYKTANHTASLLDWIAAEVGLMPKQLHITGHSLGAHGAGLTGKYIKTGTVSRITGLDPAGPLFYTVSKDQRLDKTDALFVDVLHTNGGSIVEGCCGLLKPLGHVDFYPNGGEHQAGCVIKQRLDLINIGDVFNGACSHMRATQIWVESIAAVPPALAFTAWPCSDWDTYISGKCPTCGQGCLEMGYHMKTNMKGTYFLRTNPVAPFALGDTQ
ncbi:hypothetical protein O3P69_001833 [Scylla paramamosain]|uniref:Lipase domain-containing protein n=1 Tax=Scylla paramamosain TaxID=85552 RepID=A0AAW0UZK8_SCYPA